MDDSVIFAINDILNGIGQATLTGAEIDAINSLQLPTSSDQDKFDIVILICTKRGFIDTTKEQLELYAVEHNLTFTMKKKSWNNAFFGWKI